MKTTERIGDRHYMIEYREDLSKLDYTIRRVWFVELLQPTSFTEAKLDIVAIMNDDSIDKNRYDLLNQKNPSFENSLKKHHTFEYDKERNLYVYTLIEPYDD